MTARTFGDCGALIGDAKFSMRLFVDDGCPINEFFTGVYTVTQQACEKCEDAGHASWYIGRGMCVCVYVCMFVCVCLEQGFRKIPNQHGKKT